MPAIVVGCAALSVAVAGCVNTAPEQPTPTVSEAAPPSASTESSRAPVVNELQDPLQALTLPGDSNYVLVGLPNE